MLNAVNQVNATLPTQANEWFRKDSVAYSPRERMIVNYFSIVTNSLNRDFFRQVLQNEDLGKKLIGVEDNSFYIENKVSQKLVCMFEDGETIIEIRMSPEELKDYSLSNMTDKEITEWIYTNTALSTKAIAPIQLTDCITIMGSDFNKMGMELTIYWYVNSDCTVDQEEFHMGVREYIIELIKYNHEEELALEEHMKQSTYRRSHYPVMITIVCSGDNCPTFTESILSSTIVNH